ncbi:hypothetical protein HK405_001742, partial [Cladochytrium tenue]
MSMMLADRGSRGGGAAAVIPSALQSVRHKLEDYLPTTAQQSQKRATDRFLEEAEFAVSGGAPRSGKDPRRRGLALRDEYGLDFFMLAANTLAASQADTLEPTAASAPSASAASTPGTPLPATLGVSPSAATSPNAPSPSIGGTATLPSSRAEPRPKKDTLSAVSAAPATTGPTGPAAAAASQAPGYTAASSASISGTGAGGAKPFLNIGGVLPIGTAAQRDRRGRKSHVQPLISTRGRSDSTSKSVFMQVVSSQKE